MRVACLHVPSFPLAAWVRCEPELSGSPVAVTEGEGPRAPVLACSAAAYRRGARPGQSAAQARAVCPDLILRPRRPRLEAAAQAALGDAAETLSPRVEEEGEPGTIHVECAGLAKLYGTEEDLGRALCRAAQRVGLEAVVGIATGRTAARIAALSGTGVTVIPPGRQWDLLAPLPVASLRPSPSLAEVLRRWGIRCIGDLVALPPGQVAARLGREGLELLRRARGEGERPFAPRRPPLRFREEGSWEHGADTVEALLFLLRPLLDRLLQRLLLRGLRCGGLRLSLELEGHGREEREVEVAAPTADLRALLGLVRLRLETAPPRAPVESAAMEAVAARLRPVQGDLFLPPQPEPERLALVLARLGVLCGPERVGRPLRPDSHLPGAWAMRPFAGQEAVPAAACGGGRAGVARIALRAIRPPQPLEVFCRRDRPEMVRSLPRSGNGGGFSLSGRVVRLGGPWRVCGEWWAEGYARDYYDTLLSDGAVYRIYRDLHSGEWFADGLYD